MDSTAPQVFAGFDASYSSKILELKTGNFTPPKFSVLHYSGIYYLSQESIRVLDFIKDSEEHPEIVKKQQMKKDIVSIKESNDRAGYFIYQGKKKFTLK